MHPCIAKVWIKSCLLNVLAPCRILGLLLLRYSPAESQGRAEALGAWQEIVKLVVQTHRLSQRSFRLPSYQTPREGKWLDVSVICSLPGIL